MLTTPGSVCREETCEQAAVLHYTYNRFEDLKSRRDRCDCAPTEDDAKRCFILPFDRSVSRAHLLSDCLTDVLCLCVVDYGVLGLPQLSCNLGQATSMCACQWYDAEAGFKTRDEFSSWEYRQRVHQSAFTVEILQQGRYYSVAGSSHFAAPAPVKPVKGQ